ncbi:LysR substrate-binding domain-containing protein [Roseococcus sp. DSY-14]|uniref:LysR substrate-binding domain-containing protein n=1 Tax=Roseococcus sp. DSY-14 TaxID=3369650 RepID=UPI00387B5503
MDIRHLRYFLAVAEELSFTRAAARLHIAQSPLSQQIKALEADLGVPLFHRTKRHVELTEAGRVLIGEARAILKRMDEARRAARRAHEGLTGRLVIGFTSSASYDVLPDLLAAYRAAHPDVDIVLREGVLSPDQLRAIEEGEQDVGLLRPPVRNPGIALLVVRRERLVAALPQGHKLARAARLPVGRLAGEGFIMYPRAVGAALNDPVVALCHAAGFTPSVAQEVGELQTIMRLVAAGMGVALLPASAGLLRIEGVALRPLREASPVLELALAWRRDSTSPLVRAFVALARAGLGGAAARPLAVRREAS